MSRFPIVCEHCDTDKGVTQDPHYGWTCEGCKRTLKAFESEELLDGREPVVPAFGSDAQAPEPTPSDGTIVVRTAHEFTVDGKCRDITGFFVGRDEDYLQAWSVREFLEPYEPFGIYCPDMAMYGSFVGPGTKLFVFYFAPYHLVWDEVNSLAGSSAPSPEPATAEKKEGN